MYKCTFFYVNRLFCLCLSLSLSLLHATFSCYVVDSVIMLDEAHERTLYTDIVIGLLKKVVQMDLLVHVFLRLTFFSLHFVICSQIMKKRMDLHLIVSSATLDAEVYTCSSCCHVKNFMSLLTPPQPCPLSPAAFQGVL